MGDQQSITEKYKNWAIALLISGFSTVSVLYVQSLIRAETQTEAAKTFAPVMQKLSDVISETSQLRNRQLNDMRKSTKTDSLLLERMIMMDRFGTSYDKIQDKKTDEINQRITKFGL